MRLFIILVLFSIYAHADPYEALREYENPIICKPFVEKDGIVFVSEEDKWVYLPWRDFLAMSDRLLFKYLDGVFEVPHKGYVCQQ